MNWIKIEDECPNAWEKLRLFHKESKFCDWIDHPDVWDVDGFEPSQWELRHLYDFFDENKIWTAVYPIHDKDLGAFCYGVYSDDVHVDGTNPAVKNRLQAEICAFERAFEILEEKL